MALDLDRSTTLVAFRYAKQNPLRLFYTKAGTSPRTLGVNPGQRIFRRFRVLRRVAVLESRCTAARETWTDQESREAFMGGGLQYIVPNAEGVLEVVQ